VIRRAAAYVQTRGAARAADYTFLGDAPHDPWWRAYRDATAFDHPTGLVTSDGESWAAYLSGIPSDRVDSVGTTVRYTLVFHGAYGVADADCVLAGVAAWLDDVSAGPDRLHGPLSAALDARFPADEVDRLIAGRTAPGVAARRNPEHDVVAELRQDLEPYDGRFGVERQVFATLHTLPAPPVGVDEPGDWLGAVADPAARAAFVARVATLLRGTPGRALLLNLVGGPADAAPLLDPDSPVVVLVDGATPAAMIPLRSEVGAKKAPPAPALARRAGVAAVAGTAALPVMATAVVLVALLLTVLVLLL
jgi:hypothetical protein